MKKLTPILPAFLWILLIIVSCNKEQAGTLQQAEITTLRGWLHESGGTYKNETIMVKASVRTTFISSCSVLLYIYGNPDFSAKPFFYNIK